MSVSESESKPENQEESFVEGDERETMLGYGEGKVPWYVAVVWVGFILTYAAVMAVLALPDFRAWASR
jgi:hypothetical protein